jgi:WD40 repeat protein
MPIAKRITAILVWIFIPFGVAHAQDVKRAEIFTTPSHPHSGIVTSIAFSPDGHLFASGSDDATIKLWDVASGRKLRTLSRQSAAVNSIAFWPNGKMLAAGGDDKMIRIWNVASGQLLRTMVATSIGPVSSIAISPDGNTLASASSQEEKVGDALVELWDVNTGRALAKYTCVRSYGLRVAFSPNGKTLAVGNVTTLFRDDGTRDRDPLFAHTMGLFGVKLWDLSSKRVIRTLDGPTVPFKGFKASSFTINTIAFSPDGRLLAAGAGETLTVGRVVLWRVADGSEVVTLKTNATDVNALAFSGDGKLLATANDNNTADLWYTETGKKKCELNEASDIDSAYSVAFSPDKLRMAVGFGGTIKFWQLADCAELPFYKGQAAVAPSVAFSPDGRFLASGLEDKTIAIWDMASGEVVRRLAGHTKSIDAVAFSPNGKILASGSHDNTIKLWDVSSGRELRTLRGHDNYVSSIAFSPRGGQLVSGSWDGTLKVWNVAGGQVLRTIRANPENVIAVAFSPDGRTVASGGGNFLLLDATSTKDPTVKLWDVNTGRQLGTLTGHSEAIEALAFSPDGKRLATGSYDETARIWDVSSRKNLFTLSMSRTGPSSESSGIFAVAYSPDGKLLATGDEIGDIKLWNAATGQEAMSSGTARVLPGSSWIWSVAFSHDGKLLASGNSDGPTQVWDLASGKERVSLTGFNDGSAIAVTPEGFFDSSSEQAEDNLNVRIADRVFGVSSFRESFYRPDLVKLKMQGQDLASFGSIDNVKLPPVISFASLPASTTRDDIKLNLALDNGGGGFGLIRIFWNGTVITQDGNVPKMGGALTRSFTIPLLNGKNDLRAVAFNADGSMWSDVHSSIEAKLPLAKLATARGTLHAVVIGIQTFPGSPKNNLAYPDSDAKLFADTLKRYAAPLFAKSDIHLMTGAEQTSKAALEAALKTMSATARPGDQFVFYVASHGIVQAGQYYLVTSNVGAADSASLRRDAISSQELTNLLANVPVAKKFVVIDTCEAGTAGPALAKGMSAQTAATILSRSIGLTVLSATATNQEALEGYKDHGLFTYVVADGLSGKAVSDKHGLISSAAIADYVGGEVSELAQLYYRRAQQPTVNKSGQVFAVTKVR